MISLAFIIQVPTEDTPPSCKEWICAYLSAVAGGDDHTSQVHLGGAFLAGTRKDFLFFGGDGNRFLAGR